MVSLSQTSSRALKLGIAALFLVWESSRAAVRRLAGRPVPPTFVVLAYHSVKHSERDRFARQMNHLVSAANVVDADFDTAAARDYRARAYVAVTFDDGYHSVLENAVPVLSEKYIPATLFVPTKYLGGAPAWIKSQRHRNAGERLLTVDELRWLRNKGLSIGSHGVTHRSLTEATPGEALAELVESREALEDILGEKIASFALPYGSGNAAILELARQAGYDHVFLSVPVASPQNREGRLVGRIDTTPTDWRLEFYLKIRGAYQWLPFGIAAKNRVRTLLHRLRFAAVNRDDRRDAQRCR